MPKRIFRRFKRSRRGTLRKRRRLAARPRTTVPRPLALKANYRCTLKSPDIIFENNNLAEYLVGENFRLDYAQDYGLFTAIFDQYRIVKVRSHFVPVMSEVQVKPWDDTTTVTGSVNAIPMIAFVIDRDDSAGTGTYDDLSNRQGHVIKKGVQPHTVTFRPTRLTMVYKSSTTTGYKVDRNIGDWLDCANADIPHYGLKYAFQSATPKGAYQYRHWTDYVIEWRARRH